MQAALLAGLLELGGELGAAIDLQSAGRKGHAVLQSVEELGGGWGRGAAVGLNDIPAGDHVTSGELSRPVSAAHRECQLAPNRQCGDRILLGFAHGIGPRPRRPARSRHPTARRFHQPALAFEMGKNTTRHGGLDRQLFLAQQHRQLVLAPAGKLQPQKQNFSF